MDNNIFIKVLNAVNKLCYDGNETDTSEISNEIGDLSSREVFDVIEELDDKNFVTAVLIEMCCDEDYIIKGITEEGINFLKSTNI